MNEYLRVGGRGGFILLGAVSESEQLLVGAGDSLPTSRRYTVNRFASGPCDVSRSG